MLKSLQARLGFVFAAFAALVLISAGAMVWGLETQKQDALLVNLAGRQRMLAQQMGRLAFVAGSGETQFNQQLQETQAAFESTLDAMLQGGEALYLPGESVAIDGTQNPQIRASLQQMQAAWVDYRDRLDQLQQTALDDPAHATLLKSIESQVPLVVSQADEVVRRYQQESELKLQRLRFIQVGFLAAALLLLGAGGLLTRSSILHPLQQLARAAQLLSTGDFQTPVQPAGPREIRALATSFETMRTRLQSTHRELLDLTSDLERRIELRTRELNALHEVSHEITSRLDVRYVLSSVTEKVRVLVDGDSAMLCLLDDDQQFLHLQAMSGKALIPIYDTYMSTVKHASQALTSTHAILCKGDLCAGGCGMFSHAHAASHMVAPLRIGDQVIGALCVGSAQPGHFSAESVELFTKLSNTAAIALHNARLFAQAERAATLEERQRVAAEMHDGLGQMLSYIGLMTDQTIEFLSTGQEAIAIQKLGRTRETIDKATVEVRRAIDSLINDPGRPADLCGQLQELVNDFTDETGLPVDWHVGIQPAVDFSRETIDQVVNITREALQNAARHSGAERISVRLEGDASTCSIVIADDGRGFDREGPRPAGHFGLQVMRARAAHIGGSAEILSRPGQGTRVSLSWPVEKG